MVLEICMIHTYIFVMTDERTANLLGALSLGLADAMTHETELRAEHGAAAPAALVTIGTAPGESIHALASVLGLSHSATVRLADRLTEDGLMERRDGPDRRTSALHLSRRGKARRHAILEARLSVLTAALGVLSPQEQSQLTNLMETLLGAFTRNRRHADHICRLCNEDVCPGKVCPVECAVTRDENTS